MSGKLSTGTKPEGISGEQAASRWVRDMFGRVAGRYDLLNHLLSLNLDKNWRLRTARRVRPVLERPGAVVLDLCCGTADLLLEMQRKGRGGARILGSDFCHPMLVEAARKVSRRGLTNALFEADALALPVRDGSLDLIACAFGFRNLANYEAGLAEILRALKPGGMAAILEFSQPPNRAFRAVYDGFSKLLPVVGGMVSGAGDAYQYLPASIRKFPGAEDLASLMLRAGFERVEYERMTCGAVALHLGMK